MSQKALIVDDSAKNLDILARLLSYEGVESVVVSNPVTLDSQIAEAGDIRIVFLDLEMPQLDGYQVLKKLKSDPRFQSTPIIAYTVHLSEMKEAHSQGFDGFLGKPLDTDTFPQLLARILNGEPIWVAS